MDMLNSVIGLQMPQGIDYKRNIKVEDSEKKVETPRKESASTSSADGESKKVLSNYAVLSKLNVASSKVTKEQADTALAQVLDGMKQNTGKALEAQGNVNPKSAAAVLG